MRLVQVTIPSGKRETILRALDDEGVDYVVSDETSNREYAAIAYLPLPTSGVEPVLEALREAGLDEDAYTVVMEANTVVSRRFEELKERYGGEEAEERIAREELVADARSLAPGGWTYVLMTLFSAIIATAGLLLDSPAVVVGSMVIAPLVGPALSASVGTVIHDTEMARRGVRRQALGVGVAIVGSAVFALMVRHLHLIAPLTDLTSVPEINERVAPDFLSLAVALGAGAAGIISLTSGISTALVGVMIAAALIPPAATVGIALAWGAPMVALGSGVLVGVNILSINLAALIVLWYSGYRPQRWFRQDEARSATVKRVGALAAVIVVLSVFLGGVTYDTFQRATVEERIQEEATGVVTSTDAGLGGVNISVLNVEITRTNAAIFQQTKRVVVTVGVPPDESVSNLATAIDDRVDETAGYDVDTRVNYITTETA